MNFEAFKDRVRDCIDMLGIKVERQVQQPDIDRVETTAAIGHIFDRDCGRQKLDHDIATRGDPRIRVDSNADLLGRDRGPR
jgi:hypothetical protein